MIHIAAVCTTKGQLVIQLTDMGLALAPGCAGFVESDDGVARDVAAARCASQAPRLVCSEYQLPLRSVARIAASRCSGVLGPCLLLQLPSRYFFYCIVTGCSCTLYHFASVMGLPHLK